MAAAADEQLRARLAHTEKMLKLARKHAERAERIGFARGGQAERAASKQRRRPGSKKERKAASSAMRRKASPSYVAPHTKGTSKAHLSMWLA